MTKKENDNMNGKLTDEQKAYVVRRLAEYDKPVAIAQALQELFGVTISHQAIEHYDPERPAGHDLAKQWRTVFRKARKAFIARTADVGMMYKPVRMKLRERMVMHEWEAGRCKAANEILDSIAKEAGVTFGGKHGMFGGGVPLTATVTYTGPAEPLPELEVVDGDEEAKD